MTMYLVDTDVISEARKGVKGNAGVRQFFENAERDGDPVYRSAVTIGELRQAVGSVRRRGDVPQARLLERWLNRVTSTFEAAMDVRRRPQSSTHVLSKRGGCCPGVRDITARCAYCFLRVSSFSTSARSCVRPLVCDQIF
jgi:predicted nucleic acid-binding protein